MQRFIFVVVGRVIIIGVVGILGARTGLRKEGHHTGTFVAGEVVRDTQSTSAEMINGITKARRLDPVIRGEYYSKRLPVNKTRQN